LLPSSAFSQRPALVLPSSLIVAVKRWGERVAFAPELPLAVADAHLIDTADAAIVGVELEVGPVRRVAADDRDDVRRGEQVDRRARNHVRPGLVPLEAGPCFARPALAVR
jgi:hypothetical protein